jgi:hypothetical protein
VNCDRFLFHSSGFIASAVGESCKKDGILAAFANQNAAGASCGTASWGTRRLI